MKSLYHHPTHHHGLHRPSRPALFPLHRSITDEHAYVDRTSPITRFVRRLLGVNVSRPRLEHKSHSTTSITKSSVLSSNIQPTVIDWDRHSLPATHDEDENEEEEEEEEEREGEEEDDFSARSSLSSRTLESSASSISAKKDISLAMDALQSASLIPTRPSRIRFCDFDIPPPILIGRHADTQSVMTETLGGQLQPYLPRRYRLSTSWQLLYSLDQHGASLSTLYSRALDAEGPCLLAMKDTRGQVFGAFLNEPLRISTSYYGTGECFVWKTTDKTTIASSSQHDHPPPKIKVFPWTGKNEYMMLSAHNFIALGGGDGKFGLWLNTDLERGHSEPCPTFDNEALASHPEFNCVELELWLLRI